MAIIERFGSYVFPTYQCADEDQFQDSRSALAALPVADGSFDHLGDDSPKASGTVTHKFMLVGSSYEDLDDDVDALLAAMNQGRQPLYWRQRDGTVRWAWAKKLTISLPGSGQRRLLMPVAVTFQIADPHRYDIYSAGGILWGAFIWAAGGLWGGGTATSFSFAGLSTDITVHNAGNANALAEITVDCSGIQTAENVRVARIVGGIEAQYVQATRVIAASKAIVWDCRDYSVEYDGVDDYANFSMGADQVEWLHLEPGDNTIRITCANPGDAGTITWNFYPTYH